MKINLQYPVFVFNKTGMVYIYYNVRQLKTVDIDFFTSEVSLCGNKIIDSSGMQYVTKNAYVTGSSGFGEKQNGVVSFEYKYEDAGTPITLETLKAMLLECFPKAKGFRPAWNNIKNFQGEIDRCNDFSQLALLFKNRENIIINQQE
jgi:hypothetical protein